MGSLKGWVVLVAREDGTRGIWSVWSDDKPKAEKMARHEFQRYSRPEDNPKWALKEMDLREFLRANPDGLLAIEGRVFGFQENKTLAGAYG